MALFFALIWKKPDTEEEDERHSSLKPNEQWMHEHMTETDMNDPQKKAKILSYKEGGPVPVDDDILKTAREKR